jgi:hypothetical protein
VDPDYGYSERCVDRGQSAVARYCVGSAGGPSLAWSPAADTYAKDVGALSASLSGRLEFSRPAILVGTRVFRLAESYGVMTTKAVNRNETPFVSVALTAVAELALRTALKEHAATRFVLATTGLVAITCFTSLPAAAESHEGVVRQIRIDVDASHTPLCAATNPPMPGGAWACFYPNRPHYQEMKEMLLRAFDGKHICTFEWTQRDAVTNRAQIAILTCSAR